MHIASLFHRSPSPCRSKAPGLFNRDFVLLFALCLLGNCFLAVYYCFEQWMVHVNVDAGWRGFLLGSMFGVVMAARPVVTVFLLRFSKLPFILASLLVVSAILLSYQYLAPASPFFELEILVLRVTQGFFLAIFASCTISLLVSCIPPGQSARGFALFSLTFLIPYALMPTIGEFLLPILGDEPALYAWTAMLVVPSVIFSLLMGERARMPEVTASQAGTDFAAYRRELLKGVTHSGLLLIFCSILCFSLCTSTCIYFMKGLCRLNGTDPAKFFLFYTTTIMAVRVTLSGIIDRLPRYRIVPVAALGMTAGLVIISWGPTAAYIPATVLYGAALSMLYPLLCSVIYDRSTPQTRTINSNLMGSMFDMGALVSPMLGGAILAAGFDYHWVIGFGAAIIAVCGVFYGSDGLAQRRRAGKQS